MMKGCGFLILCIIGFIGISLLYYALEPYFNEEAKEVAKNKYVDAYILNITTVDDEYDSAYLKVIPIIEYSYEGTLHVDTAYHLGKTEVRSGYVNEIGYFHYKPDTRLLLEMNADNPDRYEVREGLPFEIIFLSLAQELQTAFIVVGSILLFIFLWGLSRRFRYTEPPRSERF